MADPMRRVVVTSGRSPLARGLVETLRARPNIEHVKGVETHARAEEREDDLDIVSFVPDHRPLVEYLEKEDIDTVVQCGLVPDRSGVASRYGEADVITTMCLGAAVGHPGSRVRNWVLASSSAIYPITSHAPLVQHEQTPIADEEDTPAATIAEAESYARDVARRMPHINVAILRLQQIVGPEVRGPLASLLGRPLVPQPMGFDATIQFLHLDDAAHALGYAAEAELAGVYNVASSGTIHWSDALLAARRTGFPVLPAAIAFLEPMLRRFGVPHVPADLFDVLRFGHAVDTGKIERAGWRPEYDQLDCLSTLQED